MLRKLAILVPVLLVIFLFSLRFLSRMFDWDSVVYALNIQTEVPYNYYLNPHHIGFESSGFYYWDWIRSIFPEADLMFSLRMRILVSALLFIGAFTLILSKLYGGFWRFLALGLTVYFSQGFWFYAQHNDTPMLPACFISLTFLAALWIARRGVTWLNLSLALLAQLMSLYFHQSNILFVTLIPLAVYLAPTRNGGDERISRRATLFSRRTLAILFYLTLLGTLIIGSYLLVGLVIQERKLDPAAAWNFADWLFMYAVQETWGTSGGPKDYLNYFYTGIGDAFLNHQGINFNYRVDFSRPWTLSNGPYNALVVFWLVTFGIFFLNIRRFVGRYGKELLLFLFWLIPSILFYTWWEGYFFEFWVSTSIGLWLFSWFVWSSLEISFFKSGWRAVTVSLYFCLALFLFAVNFSQSVYWRSQRVNYGYIGKYARYAEKVRRLAVEQIYRPPYRYVYTPPVGPLIGSDGKMVDSQGNPIPEQENPGGAAGPTKPEQ